MKGVLDAILMTSLVSIQDKLAGFAGDYRATSIAITACDNCQGGCTGCPGSCESSCMGGCYGNCPGCSGGCTGVNN